MSSIRSKLVLYIAAPTLTVYVAILGGALIFLRNSALLELEQNMARLASNYAGRFDGVLREAAAVAETTAIALGRMGQAPVEDIYSQLRANVEHRPFIYAGCAAYEPAKDSSPQILFAPYVFRQGGGLVQMNITREVYDWYNDAKWTWFREPKALGKGVWSAPYFDEGAGNVLMTTYSAPFYSAGEFRGVTTVDIDLTRLRETIAAQITEGHEFAILTRDGQFVYDAKPERIMRQTIVDVARSAGNKELESLAPTLLQGRAGVAGVSGWDDAEKQWLFYAPIPSTGWTFVAREPERAALAVVRGRLLVAAAALTATLFLIVTCIALVSRRITRPLLDLTGGVREIAAGNLSARLEGITTNDELGELATAFNSMAGQLTGHIERIAEEQASRKKMERDLEIAREVQRGLLPVHQPILAGYELAGWSQPADQTGGDYYDWQTLSDGSLVISLADVTGHGIGPALVTAVCRAYARASFPYDSDLGRVFDRINALLYEDLQSNRFVTFVVALLEPQTHALHLLSAGHGPLFFFEAATKEVRSFNAHHIPLAISPMEAHGPPSLLNFAPGDALVLITDGFFEWSNPSGEQYGVTRLAEAIRKSHQLAPKAMIDYLVADVLAFVDGSPQPDDLTAVILQRTPDRNAP